ncbi:hypothetical protein PGT21_012769 [Puccinia graminis f. sp. tritici]|uniref:Uncharacterized protein n=1 Tax=Puccinia graminis f. sp. tritici TaxID=56615 RepID=A0A5B0QF41_PUCGR|nr:hypothetical protein PGT21_012769 [Puccinia graminis f. sp. tritici]
MVRLVLPFLDPPYHRNFPQVFEEDTSLHGQLEAPASLSQKYPLTNSENLSIPTSRSQKNDPPSGSNSKPRHPVGSESYITRSKISTVFRELIMLLPQKITSSLSIQFEIQKNWKQNSDKVLSLYRESEALSGFHRDLNEQFENIRMVGSAKDVDSFSDTMKLIEHIQQNIKILKQIRLLELGRCEWEESYLSLISTLIPGIERSKDYSWGTYRLGVEKELQDIGNSILDRVKMRILLESDLEASIRTLDLPPIDEIRGKMYGFKVVDFLFDCRFIDLESLSSFFRDEKVAEQVIFYSNVRIWQAKGYGILRQGGSFTDGLDWLTWNQSFKAIDRNGKRIIQRLFLKKKIDLIKSTAHKPAPLKRPKTSH